MFHLPHPLFVSAHVKPPFLLSRTQVGSDQSSSGEVGDVECGSVNESLVTRPYSSVSYKDVTYSKWLSNTLTTSKPRRYLEIPITELGRNLYQRHTLPIHQHIRVLMDPSKYGWSCDVHNDEFTTRLVFFLVHLVNMLPAPRLRKQKRHVGGQAVWTWTGWFGAKTREIRWLLR